MAGTDKDTIAGLYSEYNIQDRLRKYAQDQKNFQFMALFEKDSLSLLRILSEKFGTVPAEQVKDFVLRYPEMDELPYEFNVATTSGTTNPVTLKLTNAAAAALHTGHHLIVKGNWCAATGATNSTTHSSTNPLPETIRVLDVGKPDSNASGYANVVVKRLTPADSPGATPTAITAAMTLVLSNNTSIEDGMPYPAVSMNSGYEWNVVQTSRESYGVSEHIKSGIETFLSGSPLDTAYNLTQTRFMKTIERAILTGRRADKTGIGNKKEYTSGGVLEFIPAANIISFAKIIQPKNFTWLVKDLFDAAGTEELWLFGGTDYTTALSNAFDGYASYSKDELSSVKYNLKVDSFEAVGRPGTLKIVSAPVLNQLGMGKEALVLNLSDKHRCWQMAEKEPFKDLPEDSESLTPKGQYGIQRELYGMWTLIRRLAKTNFWVIDTSISY